MSNALFISQDIARQAFNDAFQRRVGSGHNKIRMDDLSDLAGIECRTIKAWTDGEQIPQFRMLLKLANVLGPAFMSELLAPAGLGGVEWLEVSEINPHETVAELAKETSDVLNRLKDGKFCHRDCAATGPELIELSRKLEAQGKAMIERAGQ